MRLLPLLCALFVAVVAWAGPGIAGPPAPLQAEAAPAVQSAPLPARAEIVAGNPVLAGFYATGDVWCFQSTACQHLGTDLASDYGAPVYAPYAATVTAVSAYADPARAGEYVTMDLYDGCLLYLGHLQGVVVGVGAVLTPGSLVGYIGPANHAELGWPGPHTHVQLTCGGQLSDWEAYDAGR